MSAPRFTAPTLALPRSLISENPQSKKEGDEENLY